MQVQTVFKAGNSDVVSIPKEIKEKTGIANGTDVVMSVASDGKTIMLNKVGDISASTTPAFHSWLEEFNSENRSLLEELADK